MQVIETKSEGLRREFKIGIPAAAIEEQLSERLGKIAKTAELPGFRRGKVPVSLLRKRYGPSVMGDVLKSTLNDSSMQTLSERGLRAAGQPRIEVTRFEDGSDLEFTMAVDLMPEIEPLDFSTMTLERLVIDVSDDEVDEALESLAESHKVPLPVAGDRESRDGDVIVIDFHGRVEGEDFPGGKAEGYSLELGSGSFIPGFEDQLTGARPGDEVEVKVSFPDEYGASDLAGKEAVYQVHVKELMETKAAAIDDELARTLGMESLDALKSAIRESRARSLRLLSRSRLKRQLLDALAASYQFEVPEAMADSEFDSIWAHFEEHREAGTADLEPEDEGKSDDDLKADFRAIAERRVRLGLLLAEIGRQNNLQVSVEDLNKAMMAEARRHPGREQEILDYFRNNPETQEGLTAPLYEDKVVDFILEMADVHERTVSLEELLEEAGEESPAVASPTTGAAETSEGRAGEDGRTADG